MRQKNGAYQGLAVVLFGWLHLLLQLTHHNADGWMAPQPFVHRSTRTIASSPTTQLFAFRAQEKGKLKVPEIKAERPIPIKEEVFLKGKASQIVNTEEELAATDKLLWEIGNGTRVLPDWFYEICTFEDLEEKLYVKSDNPNAIRDGDLGQWTVRDIQVQYDNEWEKDDPGPDGDPNKVAFKEWETYLPETLKDEDGIELGWTPIGGHSHPVDERTIIGWGESYNIRDITKDPSVYNHSDFHDGDLEIALNDEIKAYRKTLPIIETHEDPFFKEYKVPTRKAMWHGYEEELSYPIKNFTNNRFTKPEDMTDFDSMTPYEARKTATRYARMKNAEWLPNGVSQEWHRRRRALYDRVGTLVGTFREGEKDPEVVEAIEPALKVLGSCCTLLSIDKGDEGHIFRFKYWGLIKNKWGIKCWTQRLIRDCGVECANVIMEAGLRKRDPLLDSGDHWYADYGNGCNGDDWNDGTYEEETPEEEYERTQAGFPDDDPQYIHYYKVSREVDDITKGVDNYDDEPVRGWTEYLGQSSTETY